MKRSPSSSSSMKAGPSKAVRSIYQVWGQVVQILFSTSTRWSQALTAIATYNHADNIIYSFKNSDSGGWNKFNFHNETICLNRWLWRWCPKLCITTVLHDVNACLSKKLNKNAKIMVANSFSLGKSPLNHLFASSPPNILHVDIQQKWSNWP